MANIKFIFESFDFVNKMETKQVLNKKGDFYSARTCKKIKNALIRFEKYINGLGLTEENIILDYDFISEYKMHLLSDSLAKNTISGYVANILFLIRKFHKKGRISYDGSGIECPMEITTAIFNSVDELSVLYKMDLTPGKSRVRDIYICQCFLGLRMSDMFQFIKQIEKTIKIVDDKKYFEVKTQKTGEVVVIPSSNIVLSIFEKHNYNFGNTFSEWYYRRTLKEIVAASDLEREILFHRTEGGEKIERTVLFSDLMGSHTARRTFASNAYIAGINPLDIMKITGHKSFSSFFKYIRCDNLAVAIRISKHSFFKTEL